MRAVTFSNAKKNLRTLIRSVCENSEPAVIVDKESSEQAVLVSVEDYRSMEETAYLLRSPANRAHLEEALQQVRENKMAPFPSEDL
ncbi:MAG: type II toxin-antitoxin system prevent-host-death family antitoxin [Syntrophobacteraceae bacterium]